jgi:hypothetical protein
MTDEELRAFVQRWDEEGSKAATQLSEDYYADRKGPYSLADWLPGLEVSPKKEEEEP